MDNKSIEKIMQLSRLDLNPREKKEFPSQMKKILDYMDNLNSVSTSGIGTEDSVYIKKMPLLPDREEKSAGIKEITRNAPSFKNGFFKVKKVIE